MRRVESLTEAWAFAVPGTSIDSDRRCRVRTTFTAAGRATPGYSVFRFGVTIGSGTLPSATTSVSLPSLSSVEATWLLLVLIEAELWMAGGARYTTTLSEALPERLGHSGAGLMAVIMTAFTP